MRQRWIVAAVVVVLALTACGGCTSTSTAGSPPTHRSGTTSSFPSSPPASSPPTTRSTPPPNPPCRNQAVDDDHKSGLPELRGVSSSGVTLWVLVFHRYPVPPDRQVKFVWRMTGTSPLFHLEAFGPSDQRIKPAWGPEFHGSSSWNRPGLEWGAGFRFPTSGCWVVRARRGDQSAAVAIQVAGAQA